MLTYSVICALFIVLLAASPLQAQIRKKNPTSKVYVADVTGSAQIATGETIADLTKRSVHDAPGTIIETKDDSTNALVFSNATGIYFDPNTRLEVRQFEQEPFVPNRNDMDVEPSISRTETYLPRGTIGLCTSKLVAGSIMSYHTPHASIHLRGRKAIIEVTTDGTTVSLLEGDVTIRAGEKDGGGHVLVPGQQAFIPANGMIQISNIPPNRMKGLDDKAGMACLARKSVYFEIKERTIDDDEDVTAFDETGDTVDEINVVEVVPPGLPPAITVSAASIPQPQ